MLLLAHQQGRREMNTKEMQAENIFSLLKDGPYTSGLLLLTVLTSISLSLCGIN